MTNVGTTLSGPEQRSQSAPQGSGQAPPVVAVVVTRNPGPWFEETIAALRDQTYPRLAVLVIDAASDEPVDPRVKAVMPDAFNRRLPDNPGYSAAVNRTIGIVQGASHLVLCHDDIAPDPEAVDLMMRQAVQSNAGIVTPKHVRWHDPDVLLHMGVTVDRTAASIPRIELGDLDQGQYDDVQEVFAATGGCLLIRTDLFKSLGGLDPEMLLYGEDVDLSWRARIAGARVIVAPGARVRHLEAASHEFRNSGSDPPEDGETAEPPPLDRLTLSKRHRLRTLLKVRRGFALPLVIIQQLVLNTVEIGYGIVAGERYRVTAVVAAWTWNIAHWRSLISLRRQAQRRRTVPDSAIRPLMGSVRSRLSEVARKDWHNRRSVAQARKQSNASAAGLRDLSITVWTAVLVMWFLGSRKILADGPPVFNQFVPLIGSPMDELVRYMGSFPGEAFGNPVLVSPAHLLIGLGGSVLLGATGLLFNLMIFGMFPLGILGAYRLSRPLHNHRARLLVLLAYALVPLPYDSMTTGRLDGLVCYAVAPWLMGRLMRVYGAAPYGSKAGAIPVPGRKRKDDEYDLGTLYFGEDSAQPSVTDLDVPEPHLSQKDSPVDQLWFLAVRRVVPLALLIAAAGAFAASILLAVVVAALAVALGGLLAGDSRARSLQSGKVVAAAVFLACLMLLPAAIGSDSGLWWFFTSVPSQLRPDGLGALLRFAGGGSPLSIATYGLALAGLPALLIGKDWRLRASIRLWLVTVSLAVLSWASANDLLGGFSPEPQGLLVMAAAALALNIGIGVVAMQEDFRPSSYAWRQANQNWNRTLHEGTGSRHFVRVVSNDWRQLLGAWHLGIPLLAGLAVVVSAFPIAARVPDGAWNLPGISNVELLSWMEEEPGSGSPDASAGSFRTLWLGNGDALPGGGQRFQSDLSAAVSIDAPSPAGPAVRANGGIGQARIARAVSAMRSGSTVELGRVLAPYGVRYIVVPRTTGVVQTGGLGLPPPVDLVQALASQLDLRSVQNDQSIIVYENTAWIPIRSEIPGAAGGVASQVTPRPVLNERHDRTTWIGTVAPSTVDVKEQASEAWQLSIGDTNVPREKSDGWANSYRVTTSGVARLNYVAPVHIRLFQLLNLALWAAVALLAIRYRYRRGRYT